MAAKGGRLFVGVSALVLGLVATVPAVSWAQAGAGKKAVSKMETEIEEVTVVAQKREENIQEVPISISALTSQKLEQHNISDLMSLGSLAPNVRVSNGLNGVTEVNIAIRGVTQTLQSQTVQPGVGLYIDGFYIAKIQGNNFDLEDLERVEVLRGPQGSLYGRNTIAGAFNIITRKPSEQRSITLPDGGRKLRSLHGTGEL